MLCSNHGFNYILGLQFQLQNPNWVRQMYLPAWRSGAGDVSGAPGPWRRRWRACRGAAARTPACPPAAARARRTPPPPARSAPASPPRLGCGRRSLIKKGYYN